MIKLETVDTEEGRRDEQLAALRFFFLIMSVKIEWLRVCLWGIFQSGGTEDVMQLIEDWWSESMRWCAAPCSPGGTEPWRMALYYSADKECNFPCSAKDSYNFP